MKKMCLHGRPNPVYALQEHDEAVAVFVPKVNEPLPWSMIGHVILAASWYAAKMRAAAKADNEDSYSLIFKIKNSRTLQSLAKVTV